MALTYGGDFIDVNAKYQSDGVFYHPFSLLLSHSRWTLSSIELLLRNGCKASHPNAEGTCILHFILKGSFEATMDDMEEALCLLIRVGAGIYEEHFKDRMPSHIACDRCSRYGSLNGQEGQFGQTNHDLRLLQIWKDALRACGYDAEEVIKRSVGDIEEFVERNVENVEEDIGGSVGEAEELPSKVLAMQKKLSSKNMQTLTTSSQLKLPFVCRKCGSTRMLA